MKNVRELLNERKTEYHNAWYVAGSVLHMFNDDIYTSNLFSTTPYGHNWVVILSKMFRALHTPNNTDHWQDIIGYCQLILDDLEQD